MLTRDQLAELYRKLRGEKVLSVYLNGMVQDPARRRVWRRRLLQELDREKGRVDQEAPEEKDDFLAAREHILKELDGFQSFLPGKGWAGFSLPTGVWYAESLPVQVRNLVRWERGPRVSPYVRGLKQLRPMVTVLVDGRRSRIFLYKEGRATERADLRADTFLGDLLEAASSQRAVPHTGTRGETATDAAQRALEVGTARMLKRVKELCCELVGLDGFLLIGGTQEARSLLRSLLPRNLEERILEHSSLFLDMSLPEVKAATAEGASILSKRRQESLLDQILEQAHAQGNGCLGGKETSRALGEGRVDTLLLSRSFVDSNPDFADQLVGQAFEQRAEVRVLSGAPAERLNAEGGGVGARLRYRLEPALG